MTPGQLFARWSAAFEPTDQWIDAAIKAMTPTKKQPKKPGNSPEIPEGSPPPDQPATTEPNGQDDRGPNLRNEFADANRLVVDILNKAWFCPKMVTSQKTDIESGWLVWDGQRLAPSEDGAIVRLAMETAIRLSDEALEPIAEWKEQIAAIKENEDPNKEALRSLRARISAAKSKANQLQSIGRIKKIIEIAAKDRRLLIDQSELDADENLLNCQNGVIDLRNGELLAHDPKYRCTRIAAVPYLPNADRAVVRKVLERAMQIPAATGGEMVTDHERVRYFQDAIGQALFGHQRWQRFYLCQGDGGDGKGTFFEALLDALGGGHGGYAMKADMQSFVRQRLSGHKIRDDLANMAGARIVMAAEINKGDALDAALVKTLSGEDTQRVRHLFGKEFEFRPICSMFFQANNEPYVDSSDAAVWRRLVKIPFGPPLRDHERDPAIRQQLHDPHTGGAAILAWAVEGAVRTASAARPSACRSVDDATADYRSDMDPLAGFFASDLRFASPGNRARTFVASRALQPALDRYLADAGQDDRRGGPLITAKRLGDSLRRIGCFSHRKKISGKAVAVWMGVTLSDEIEELSIRGGTATRDELVGGHNPEYRSHLPTDSEHEEALAAAGICAPVTSVTSFSINTAHVREKNTTRARTRDGNFSDHARVFNTDEVTEVTEKDKRSNIKDLEKYSEKTTDVDIPDLDAFEDDPPF